MIHELLEHHLERAQERGIKNAISNCHVYGLTSIMLHDEPGNRIRLFHASYDHGLGWDRSSASLMPLAIHAHHCSVRLVGLFGQAESLVYRDSTAGQRLHQCLFVSPIGTKDRPRLIDTGRQRSLELYRAQELTGGKHQRLTAYELHTVTVPHGREAAWLVIEGAEDRAYQPWCFTNNPKWDPTGLYRKATALETVDAIASTISRLEARAF